MRDLRKKITYVSDAPYIGGAEKYLLLLAGGLDRDRFDVSLVTTGSHGVSAVVKALERKGVRIEDTGGEPFGSANGILRLRRIISSLNPDIIHMNMPGPFDCCYGVPAVLARLSGLRRIVVTEHLPMIKSFPKAKLLRSAFMAPVSRHITVSEDNRKYLMRNHGVSAGKIRVVLNGIPDPVDVGTRSGAPKNKEKELRLLSAGSLEERKGHAVLLSAMKRLPAGVTLSIAGDGPLREKLVREADSEDLAGRVSFLGRVDDIGRLIVDSDALVVPSLLEATPYVIIEAMAFAKPVVASAVFGIPEQVVDGETGILAQAGDPDSLAEAIRFLLDKPESADRMGKAGRKRFEELFTLERSIGDTVSVYEELL